MRYSTTNHNYKSWLPLFGGPSDEATKYFDICKIRAHICDGQRIICICVVCLYLPLWLIRQGASREPSPQKCQKHSPSHLFVQLDNDQFHPFSLIVIHSHKYQGNFWHISDEFSNIICIPKVKICKWAVIKLSLYFFSKTLRVNCFTILFYVHFLTLFYGYFLFAWFAADVQIYHPFMVPF